MKVWNIIKSVIVWLIVALAACMMIFTIVSVATFDRADRNLFGFKAFIVLSDSMKKTDFNAGDLVLVKEVDPSTLKEGDIIAYTSQNSSNYGETVTHKIRRLTTDANGEPGFVTYGTTTDTDDETIVTYPYVLGKYKSHIPKVGTFFRFLKTTPGYIVCILIPFMLLILTEGIRCIRLFRTYKAEQQAELQAQKADFEQGKKRLLDNGNKDFVNPKEKLYDKFPLTVHQMDIIIGVLFALIALFLVLGVTHTSFFGLFGG